ncbi:MAG: PadR family transcriptional regulator [Candidatus Bipolaricaulia bacterium]
MSLDHAILGFLSYGPFSGYDLKKVFDRSVRHFWPADQSQIYRTLTRLGRQRYVEVERIAQEDRPNRKVYHITDEGREELRRWVSETRSENAARKPFLVQSFFAGMLNDEEILGLFEARAQELRDRLETYEALAGDVAEGKGQEGPPREQFFWYLTLDNGIWNAQAELDWLEDAMKRIKRKEYEQGGRVLPAPRRER